MIVTEQLKHLLNKPIDENFLQRTFDDAKNTAYDGYLCYVYNDTPAKNGFYFCTKNENGNIEMEQFSVSHIKELVEKSQLPTFDDTPIISAIGGLAAGTDISGKNVYEVLATIIYPYVAPSATIATNQAKFVAYDATLNSVVVTATITKGKNDLNKVTFCDVEFSANELAALTSKENVTVTRNGRNYTFTKTFNNLTTTKTYTATVTDGTKTATASATITFIRPKQYGFVGEILTDLYDNNNKAATLTYDSNGAIKKAQYAYPSVYGDLTKITDGSGVTDYTDDFAKTNETRNGVVYNVYTLKSASVHSNFTYKFA